MIIISRDEEMIEKAIIGGDEGFMPNPHINYERMAYLN